MFGSTLIAPSILSADFLDLRSEVASIAAAGADWVHVDVMDGHFVPNLTMGVPVVAALCAHRQLPVDVHLMIANPLEQLPWYLKAHPDVVNVHWEAFEKGSELAVAEACSHLVRKSGAKAAVALKPDTPIEVLRGTLGLWDMVLVMSVFPGFSGQSFIEDTPRRIAQLVALCELESASPLIQVDGGINPGTAALVAAEGADCLVAGNAFFKAPDRAFAVGAIRSSAQEARLGRQTAKRA